MANKEKKGSFLKDALALCIITLVAGALLGLVNELTAPVIRQKEMDAQLSAYKEVFAEADRFDSDDALTALVASDSYTSALATAGVEKAAVAEAFVALDASGNKIGYVMTTNSSAGFGGDISISVGVDASGNVVGMKFLVLNETSGLGSKAAEPAFMDQFIGQGANGFTLGGNIDAMSGATITSKAVANAMNAATVLVAEASK